MSTLDTFISNLDKVAYTTVFDMDKIIASIEGTFVATAPGVGSMTTTTQVYPTGFGDTYYFHGIYSTDNGASWNDFNAMVPDVSTPSMPVFQTIQVVGAVSSAGALNVIAFNHYDNVHGTGTAKTILWKAALFSKNRQGSITPLQIPGNTAFTTVERSHQKIAQKGEIPFDLTSGSGKTSVINHNLGYVPTVRAFYQQASPSVRMDNLWGGYRIDIQIDENNVTFVLDAELSDQTVSGQIEYRIYYAD